MKKSRLIFFITLAAGLTFGSCKKDTSKPAPENSSQATGYEGSLLNDNSASNSIPEYQKRYALTLNTNMSKLVDFDSVNKFFTLDFTPEYPDTVFDNTKNQKDADKKGSKISADQNDTSESHIPGIRKLSDYVTKYVTKKASLQEYKPIDEPEEEDDSTKEFFIEDWGPQGNIVGSENHPSFYVIFSRPARSLQALDKPQKTSDIMKIEPPLPGVFRWYGTKHLSFESDIPADPTIQYTITIKPDLKSAGGKTLTGNTSFKTKADPVVVTNIWGGYVSGDTCNYDWYSGALPPYENSFVIRTNYTSTLYAIEKNLTVYVNGNKVDCDIQPVYKNIFMMWANPIDFDEAAGRTNTFLFEIKSKVPHEAIVEVRNIHKFFVLK